MLPLRLTWTVLFLGLIILVCVFSLIEVGDGSKGIAPLAQGGSERGCKNFLAHSDEHFPP